MRNRLAAMVVASALLSAPRAAVTRPNVVLVTLDTTRADRMGFLGSTRGLTPALDLLAREAIVFTRAYAQAPITPVSHATILTGAFPPFHHVVDFGIPLPATVPYLPDLLRQQGYRTAAFVGSLVLDPVSGTAPGFDRGFDRYDAGFHLRLPGQNRYETLERRGDEVIARARTWLDTVAREPFALWVHLYDPHDPYDPPEDLKARFASAPYDGEIASVDRLAGRLADALRSRAQLDRTIFIVTADHGEALGDHGEETHGLFLYDASLRVPLLVRLPGRLRAGARVSARVRLADIAPTVLDALGLAVPPAMQGQSLLGLAGRAKADDRPVYAETEYPRRGFGWTPLVSWRSDRFLFVRAPRRELYDEVADAGELRNLASSRGRVADAMDAELGEFVRRAGAGRESPKPPPIDAAVAERLAALGYVSQAAAAPAPVSGVDPKDKVAIGNALHSAMLAVEDGDFKTAIPRLEQVTASEPHIPLAQLNLGIARAHQRQYAQAIAPLRRALALQPDVMLAHYELGVALYETGDLKTAARHFEIVALRMPKWADARYSLGSVYARIDRVAEAVGELRAALALEPRHFRANLLLGRILTLQGQAGNAVTHLRSAAEAQPASAEAHQFLADAYERAGNAAEAAKERRRAKELEMKK
jgi:arylsulfatase A-like enzyme/Flp pilus assembly protein TadD